MTGTAHQHDDDPEPGPVAFIASMVVCGLSAAIAITIFGAAFVALWGGLTG